MSNWQKNGISVLVPTFQRLQGIERTLTSLLQQALPDAPFEIIVADNDPVASARELVSSIAAQADKEIIYLHCDVPGVSNARNTMMARARGRYIFWLDDDQVAGPNWIKGLLSTAEKFGAALVFCPTRSILEGQTDRPEEYKKFFDRAGPVDERMIERFHGCGNSMMDVSKFDLPSPVFCPTANQSGGEDDKLFTFIQDQDVITAWTPHVFTEEYIPASRSTPQYIIKRSLAWGQGPTELANDEGDVPGIIRWMIIGFMQYLVWAPICLYRRLFRRPGYIDALRRKNEGLGKMFWWDGFKQKLYGASQLREAANKA